MIQGDSLSAKAAHDTDAELADVSGTVQAESPQVDVEPAPVANDFLARTRETAESVELAETPNIGASQEAGDAPAVPDVPADDDAEVEADLDWEAAERSRAEATVEAAGKPVEDERPSGGAIESEPPASTPPPQVPASAATPEPSPAASEKTGGDSFSGLGMQALHMLSERLASSEKRTAHALEKIGGAIGTIAERIDGIETRIADDAINSVAAARDTSVPRNAASDDERVAPYLAAAERELTTAKMETGQMDIFDRIARAAETEFDSAQPAAQREAKPERPGDLRRVGTKRWTPSRTVKRRMAQLEEASGSEVGATKKATKPAQAPRGAVGETVTLGAQPRPAPAVEKPAAAFKADLDDAKASAAVNVDEPFVDDDFDSDDPLLSVVPGARGRRRNRARKTRLDDDFESVFTEEGDKASIGSLRRKLREADSEKGEADEAGTEAIGENKGGIGGLLGRVLRRKKSKASADALELDDLHFDDDDGADEAEMMAAFDDPPQTRSKPSRKGRKANRPTTADDEADGRSIRFMGGQMLYLLIGVAALAVMTMWFLLFK